MNVLSDEVTSKNPVSAAPRMLVASWCIAAIWLAAFVWAKLPSAEAGLAVAGLLQLLAIIVLAFVHAAAGRGWRGALAFLVIAVSVSFMLEASSIATGFPFGFYVHNAPGPKPLGVPLHVPPSYFFLGWLAWTQACLITRSHSGDSGGFNRLTTPVVGAFIMTGYDFAIDPIGSTVQHLWVYRSPSGLFGVPLTNFLGWIFTGWTMLQLYALVESRFPPRQAVSRSPAYWLLPCLVWAVSALQYPVDYLLASSGVAEVGGRSFVVADIYETSVIAALLTMVFTAIVAVSRVPAFISENSD